MENRAIFDIINEAMIDGKLPEDFKLPKEEDGHMPWADGALDGVSIYHMGMGKIDENSIARIGEGLKYAVEDNYVEADKVVAEVANKHRAICIIDDLQGYIVDHQAELQAGAIYKYGLHLLLESSDVESVKIGLVLLELFDVDDGIKDAIRVVGLSDEFTIFSIFVVRGWDNGQMEILNLAKNVEGWGRIHAVEFIEPENDEIKVWLLKEGTRNWVMPAYSGLTCYKKADVETLLKKPELTYEEIKGILAIVNAMLDEGPVPGISEIENPESMLARVLEHAAKHLPLQPWDCEAVNNISDWQEENGEDDNPNMEAWIDAILCDPETRKLIHEEVKKGNHIHLAKSIGLPYEEDLYAAMESDFEHLYGSCGRLMKNESYVTKVIDLFRKNMDLNNFQIEPNDSLGIGNSDADKLDFILQELKDKQGKGDDFVVAALKSPLIRNKNGALNVLEAWVEDNKRPLVKIAPDFYKLLTDIVDDEKEDTIHNRMERLLAGTIAFEDEENE